MNSVCGEGGGAWERAGVARAAHSWRRTSESRELRELKSDRCLGLAITLWGVVLSAAV